MYTIKEFADIIGVTPQTLRNKHKNGQLIPTLVNPTNGYRMYSDELAYIHSKDKHILAYISNSDDKHSMDIFKDKLSSFNLKYEIFENSSEGLNLIENGVLESLLRRVSEGKTYTILYDESNIKKDELELINFCIRACFSYVQVKPI